MKKSKGLVMIWVPFLLFISQILVAKTPFDDVSVKVSALQCKMGVSSPSRILVSSNGIHFRVAGYNIAHARGNKSGGINELARGKNLRGIGDLLKDQKIDVVGLTEISSGDLRAGFRNQPEYIANFLGFFYVYAENIRMG
ncbi:hypothetical protein HYY75_12345, partial [bacterium]|nr:hypothetical protein [bacterium]